MTMRSSTLRMEVSASPFHSGSFPWISCSARRRSCLVGGTIQGPSVNVAGPGVLLAASGVLDTVTVSTTEPFCHGQIQVMEVSKRDTLNVRRFPQPCFPPVQSLPKLPPHHKNEKKIVRVFSRIAPGCSSKGASPIQLSDKCRQHKHNYYH